MNIVATLTLSSQPRQGLARLRTKRRSLGMKENVREWTLTLPRELPPWELDSWRIPEGLWNVQRVIAKAKTQWIKKYIYIIEKLLKRRCLKWARMTHLDIWNTSYGQKKGRESNWQFHSWALKVKNQLDFLVCRWRATYRWKVLDKVITLLYTSSQSEVCT